MDINLLVVKRTPVRFNLYDLAQTVGVITLHPLVVRVDLFSSITF